MDESGDVREDEVAEVARRAAMAASARRSLARTAPEGMAAQDVDEGMLTRLGLALERIESACTGFAGAMVFRGMDAAPLVSLLPDFGSDDARRTITRIATAVRMQYDLLEDGSLGRYVDSVISTERGAFLVKSIRDDLVVVSLAGTPPDVAPAWRAMAAERAEIEAAAAELFLGG